MTWYVDNSALMYVFMCTSGNGKFLYINIFFPSCWFTVVPFIFQFQLCVVSHKRGFPVAKYLLMVGSVGSLLIILHRVQSSPVLYEKCNKITFVMN